MLRYLLLTCLLTTAASALTVSLTSPRPGLTFTDSEPVDVRVSVSDAPAEVTVHWSARETEGSWTGHGELRVTVTQGRGEVPLRLGLPGRGLFPVTLEAACGAQRAEAVTNVAVVYTPPAPDPASPVGIFYTPRTWIRPPYPNAAEACALSHRLLGASWSRLNFWAGSFGKITVAERDGKPDVSGDWQTWKEYAKALRAEGISILGEIAQCPAALSSQPDARDVAGDAGERRLRVKPRDYAEWDSLMENLARDFADEIDHWEIWNEANLRDRYWSGTPEELVELVEHTTAALKRGNPDAKILGCGFVHDRKYADHVLELGLGQYLDIFSVHYTDEHPGEATAWRELLTKHGLDLPLWNSEERSEVPLQNLAEGIQRSFKFMHLNTGYEDYRLLVNADFTCRRPAVWHAVGAHFLSGATYLGPVDCGPGRRGYALARGAERLLAVSGNPVSALFQAGHPIATIEAEPLTAAGLSATNRYGRSWPVPLTDGRGQLALESGLMYLSGAKRIKLLGVAEPAGGGLAAEAEGGTCSAGWGRSRHPGFSGDLTLDIWADAEPGPEGYWAEVKLNVPQAGRYQVIFAGNSLSRLRPPRSLSPFVWQFDGGAEHLADQAQPTVPDVTGAPGGVNVLGEVDLTAGEHTFRLRLTGRRDQPDQHYALWFDAIALRPVE